METDKIEIGKERHLFLRVKSFDESNPNIVHATVSTSDIDRHGEIIQPDAFRDALPPFIDNPVVLPCHKHRLESGEPPVIGNVLTDNIKITKSEVDMTIEFDDDELGQKYARKYRKKVMRAFSIGFIGLEGKYEEIDGKRTWIWTKIELLEISAVAVPSNRRALLRARGFYETEDLTEKVVAVIEQKCADHLDRLTTRIEDSFDEIKSLLIPDPDGFAKGLLGGPSDSSAPDGDKISEQQIVEVLAKALKTVFQ
jgi:HK97 family phage prohead protease